MPAPALIVGQMSHDSLTLRLHGTARLTGGGHRIADVICDQTTRAYVRRQNPPDSGSRSAAPLVAAGPEPAVLSLAARA